MKIKRTGNIMLSSLQIQFHVAYKNEILFRNISVLMTRKYNLSLSLSLFLFLSLSGNF